MRWNIPLRVSKRMEIDTFDSGIMLSEIEIDNDWNERQALISAIEGWLETWDKEFVYHDRHGIHMSRRTL